MNALALTPDTVRAVSTGLFVIVITLTVGIAAWNLCIEKTAAYRELLLRRACRALSWCLYPTFVAAFIVVVACAIPAILIGLLIALTEHHAEAAS